MLYSCDFIYCNCDFVSYNNDFLVIAILFVTIVT